MTKTSVKTKSGTRYGTTKKAAKKTATGNIITNCQFVGVKFDAAATEAIKSVAEGLLENAKGLGVLARVLNASGVTIEALLKVGDK